MSLISNLGHVGIICDDFLKMRDFYTRVLGLTVTDEDPDRGSCFLSADPENEHHELNLGQANENRPRTENVGQVSFIVPSMDALRELNRRFKVEDTPILRTVTHGISHSIYFHDPRAMWARSITRPASLSSRALAVPSTWKLSPMRIFSPSPRALRLPRVPSRGPSCR